MPIVYRKKISDYEVLGVWKITESVDELLSMINFTDYDYNKFEEFGVKSKQIHWLSYRVMIRQLINDDELCDFYYDEHGKLQFRNIDYSISVTHSGIYSGVIISKRYYVGIDIERIRENINPLAQRFLSEEENKNLPENTTEDYLTIIWSAKEALFKLFGKSNVSLEKNISISPFELKKSGTINGKIEKEEIERNYTLGYEFSNDDSYVLVYCIDDTIDIKPKIS